MSSLCSKSTAPYAPANRFAEVQRRSGLGVAVINGLGEWYSGSKNLEAGTGRHLPTLTTSSRGDVARTMLYAFKLLTSADCVLLSVLAHITGAEE